MQFSIAADPAVESHPRRRGADAPCPAGPGPRRRMRVERPASGEKNLQFHYISTGYVKKARKKQSENQPKTGRKQGKSKRVSPPETACRPGAPLALRPPVSMRPAGPGRRAGAAQKRRRHPVRRLSRNLRLQRAGPGAFLIRAPKKPRRRSAAGSRSLLSTTGIVAQLLPHVKRKIARAAIFFGRGPLPRRPCVSGTPFRPSPASAQGDRAVATSPRQAGPHTPPWVSVRREFRRRLAPCLTP